MRIRHRSALGLVALLCAAGLAACGSSSSTTTTTTTTTSTTTTTVTANTTACDTGSTVTQPIPKAEQSPVGTSGTAPTVTVPTSAPPTQLQCADLIVGTGPKAVAGDSVTVQYVLGTYSTHMVIQSSWTSQPYTFTLGEGQVIPGWDKGVVGMQAGGRRELIIPPSLGYGSEDPGGGVSANDTLVYVIDMVSVN